MKRILIAAIAFTSVVAVGVPFSVAGEPAPAAQGGEKVGGCMPGGGCCGTCEKTAEGGCPCMKGKKAHKAKNAKKAKKRQLEESK